MSFLSTGVAVVTGAGSGIGRALARQLAAAGSALALADVDEAGLLETAQSLEKKSALVTTHVVDVADEAGLHFVQLHGTETPEFCQQIKRPVIKALHLHSEADLDLIRLYKDAAWHLLLDTPTPAWGGTGVTHDWQIAQKAARISPVLLAGGLTAENVATAIQQVHPWGIDVSSGVETDKQKDPTKIRAFIQAVRSSTRFAPRSDERS